MKCLNSKQHNEIKQYRNQLLSRLDELELIMMSRRDWSKAKLSEIKELITETRDKIQNTYKQQELICNSLK